MEVSLYLPFKQLSGGRAGLGQSATGTLQVAYQLWACQHEKAAGTQEGKILHN